MGYVAAYKCPCGMLTPKKILIQGGGGLKEINAINGCCPLCGRIEKLLKHTSGKWTYKKAIWGWWVFKKSFREENKFVESEFNGE